MANQTLTAALLAAAALASGSCCPCKKTQVPVAPPPSTQTTAPAAEAKPMEPTRPWPATRRDDVVDTIFGVKVSDPYRWLENADAPEVKQWMTAQDSYARGELAKLPGREEFAKRLREVFYYDAQSAPHHAHGRYFYTRKHADREKTIVYWKQGEQGEEKVLFDPNAWSTDGSKGLGGWWPNHQGTQVAYALKANNADEAVIHVIDVATGKDLPDVIEGGKYADPAWTPDGKGFYYTWVPAPDAVPVAERPGFAEFRYHAMGTDAAKDVVLHGATKDPETFLAGNVSYDGHWLFVAVLHGWNSSDTYFQDLRGGKKPDAKNWKPLTVGIPANFATYAWRDHFYIHTNDGAPRYHVFKVDPAHPARDAWKEIVAQNEATLEGIDIVGEHLVLKYLRNAANELEIHDLEGALVRKVALPPLGTSGGIGGNPDEDTAYFDYTSFTEPSVIYRTSIKTGKVDEYARVKLPIDTTTFVTEQVFYPSKDGTSISMFLIHRKDVKRDGSTPTILYGYGGFNVSLTPEFSSSRAVWLEHGGMYAIPNLRGGGEYGEDWHKAGMGAKKQNVFDDMIGAAKYLIAEKWTTPAHLAISGGSNGGLLVGATMTQAPELFHAVICGVPLLDMIRFPLVGAGKTWVPEYGSPDDETQFKTLLAYSPYHHVADGTVYPALLMDSADHDDRVDPMHARKFSAAVQHAQAASAISSSPILLRIEKNAGHGGADMVKAAVERIADQFAFLTATIK